MVLEASAFSRAKSGGNHAEPPKSGDESPKISGFSAGWRQRTPSATLRLTAMARIIGKLDARDEYTHEVGSEPNFNESMYFNFFDPARRTGGFLRIGNRPNEGYAEVTTTVFLPDGRVLFDFQRPKIGGNGEFNAAGTRFEVLDPTERLRTTMRGKPVALREPRDMIDPRHAFTANPHVSVSIDLLHTAVGPLYGNSHDESEADSSPEQQFAKAHYEQHMHVSGGLDIDGERIEISGNGLRDHSWGPRYWQAIGGYEWVTMNFGDDLGAMLSVIRRPGKPVRMGGVLVRGDTIDPIDDIAIEIEYEDGGLFHRALAVDARTRGGERLAVEGRVLGFIPLRNRRGERTTHVGEGMTEWRLGNRVGFGLSELLRTL
jgi:hypothetical protein